MGTDCIAACHCMLLSLLQLYSLVKQQCMAMLYILSFIATVTSYNTYVCTYMYNVICAVHLGGLASHYMAILFERTFFLSCSHVYTRLFLEIYSQFCQLYSWPSENLKFTQKIHVNLITSKYMYIKIKKTHGCLPHTIQAHMVNSQ